jgi:hypothetical protein
VCDPPSCYLSARSRSWTLAWISAPSGTVRRPGPVKRADVLNQFGHAVIPAARQVGGDAHRGLCGRGYG